MSIIHIMNDSFVDELRETEFPTLDRMVYLNNAATGIMPNCTLDAMKKYLHNRVTAKGDFEDTLAALGKVREYLGELLGGDKKCYGFVPNTSTGLNTFANGIEYPEGSNIVICDLEFPANYIPWQHIARRNRIELRVAKSVEGHVPFEEFMRVVDEDTRVLAVSLVQFASGFVADVRRLAKAMHDIGGYLAVDIIQGAGWKNINLEKLGVDFASAQAAKWLIGPIGAGFLYLRKELIDVVYPTYLGWWGVKDMKEFAYTEREPLQDARRFEVGSPSMIAYVGFLKSLELLLQIPAKKRENAALNVADYFRSQLEELEIDFYRFSEENKSPIVSCEPQKVESLHKSLQKANIHCSVRNGRLRVSPHFYNTKEEIDTLVEYMR